MKILHDRLTWRWCDVSILLKVITISAERILEVTS